ncbi:MAG TPA: aromatic-ring-hydroxylating dioxygenase subunit beta [Stellaceae bacterium]|nr:aromatic-ring-hydroxylating dioxygenase subunit beta [Stellaceae bacterium]
MSAITSAQHAALLAIGVELLGREACYLDERRWDEWLALYARDCEFWVPTWTAEGELTTSPQTELSLMYYAARGGLEDRIVRIRSGRSPAALPLPRTTHIVSNILLLEPQPPQRIRLRSSWVCHAFFPLLEASHTFFGRAEYELALREERWAIAKKKTILENDRIPMAIDVYCL